MGEEGQSKNLGDVAVHDVPPVRDIAFSMLSVLIETAAVSLRVGVPSAPDVSRPVEPQGKVNMNEARAAIDAANGLLSSVRAIMENDALRAIEGMLTQLQIEYVRRLGRSS
jgi:hypothetical protein